MFILRVPTRARIASAAEASPRRTGLIVSEITYYDNAEMYNIP